jgi:hypothetical protein
LTDSFVTADVQVNLTPVAQTLSASIPKALSSGTDNLNVSANQTVLSPIEVPVTISTNVTKQVVQQVSKRVSGLCQKSGILGKLAFFACDTTQLVNQAVNVTTSVPSTVMQKVNKLTNIKGPINVVETHNVYFDSLALSMNGNQLNVQLSADFDIDVKADASIVKVGVARCGIGEDKPQVQLAQPIAVSWGTDGLLLLNKEQWSLSWTKPCNLTFADVNLEQVLQLTNMENTIDQKIDAAIKAMPAQIDVSNSFNSAWNILLKPQPIADHLWLSVQPTSISVSNPTGTGQQLQLIAGLDADPLITYGKEPQADKTTRPQVRHNVGPGHFSLNIEGTVSYDDLASVLNSKLGNMDRVIDGHHFRMSNFHVYPSGTSVVLAVDVTKPFRGTIYLSGEPIYDPTTQVVSLRNLDFTAQTKNFLIKSADWILHANLQSEIQGRAQYPVSPYLAEATKKLANYKYSSANVDLTINAPDVQVSDIYTADKGVFVRVNVQGQASVSVQ